MIDPTHPAESARYNPFYALDDAYQEHVNFIFRSFGLREDFFKGHQEAYLSDLVRILQYTGKLFNVYDVLVMALDEKVLEEQIGVAKARLASVPGISMQKRLNFEMSVKMLQRSLADRERVEKIQGLLNELLSFLEDELSIVTGSYQDLLTLDDVLEQRSHSVCLPQRQPQSACRRSLGKDPASEHPADGRQAIRAAGRAIGMPMNRCFR